MPLSFLKGSFEGLCNIDSLIQSVGNALLELGEWCVSHPCTQRTSAGSVHRVTAWQSGVSKVVWIVQQAFKKVSSPAKLPVCAGEEQESVHRIMCV